MSDETTPASLRGAEMPYYHKTMPVQVWVDIDQGIADVVRHLNTMEGVRTHTSCEGTPCLIYPNGSACYVEVSWEDDAALARIQGAYTVQIESTENHWGYVLAHGDTLETDDGGQPHTADIPHLLATLAARDAELAALRSEAKAAEINSDSAQNLIAESVDNCERLEQEITAYREVRGLALADIARLAGERDTARRALAALEREHAAMRGIVAAVADKEPLAPDDDAGHWVTCLVGPCDPQSSDDTYVHAPECLITRARALLATPPADAAQQP